MAAETQYTVNTGMVTISTANTARDGTGTMGDVITGALNGTVIKSITIKAQTNTTQGTIRLYIYNGSITGIFAEISVPAVTKSSRDRSFEVHLRPNLFLKSGYILRASTEKSETFNVIAIGLDQSYYSTSVRTDTTKYTANTGAISLSVANPNLDGTGTMVNIIRAGAFASGTRIEKLHISATSTTTPGMIRLFIRNDTATVTKLWREIPVPAVTPTSKAPSFNHLFIFKNLFLEAGYYIMGATENAESFLADAEGGDITYVS